MPKTSKDEQEVVTDYREQINEVYHKLSIDQQSEKVHLERISSSENPFGENSYYWFK